MMYMYYPSNVHEYLSIEFSWAILGKYFYNNSKNMYFLRVPKRSKFFDSISGKSYRLIDDAVLSYSSDLSADGRIKLKSSSRLCKGPLILNVGFLWNNMEKLELVNTLTCPLIKYSKSRYNCISETIPNFPSPTDIDQIIKNLGCTKTCLYLFKLLDQY